MMEMENQIQDMWLGEMPVEPKECRGADVQGWQQWFGGVQRDFEVAMEALQAQMVMDARHVSEGFGETMDRAKMQHGRLVAALQAYNLFCEVTMGRP